MNTRYDWEWAGPLETTLAIIKPCGMQHRMPILKMIHSEGFQITQRKITRLTPEQAAEFYESLSDTPSYNLMILGLSEGPVEVLCLTKANGIEDWKTIVGSEDPVEAYFRATVRGLHGMDCDLRNVVHASENKRRAKIEIHYFFPNTIVEPICREDAKRLCCYSLLVSALMDGLAKVSILRPPDPVEWLAKLLLEFNPFSPVITGPSDDTQRLIDQLGGKACGAEKCRELVDAIAKSGNALKDCLDESISCKSSMSQEPSGTKMHDETCPCSHILKPHDQTFCPICHTIMEVPSQPDCAKVGKAKSLEEICSCILRSSSDGSSP